MSKLTSNLVPKGQSWLIKFITQRPNLPLEVWSPKVKADTWSLVNKDQSWYLKLRAQWSKPTLEVYCSWVKADCWSLLPNGQNWFFEFSVQESKLAVQVKWPRIRIVSWVSVNSSHNNWPSTLEVSWIHRIPDVSFIICIVCLFFSRHAPLSTFFDGWEGTCRDDCGFKDWHRHYAEADLTRVRYSPSEREGNLTWHIYCSCYLGIHKAAVLITPVIKKKKQH